MRLRCIVSTNLGTAGTIGRGTIELVEDEALDQVSTMVDTSGHDEDAEHVLFRWDEAQLGARPVDLWADVHGGTGLVRRDELGVEGDGGLNGVNEQVLGHGRTRDELGGALHAGGIAVGTKDGDLVIGSAEGLQPLVGLLTVIQSRGHAVDADVGVRNKLEGRPFARLDRVVRLDVTVHFCQSTLAPR